MDPDVSGVPRVSPGGHELSQDFIAQHQRERTFRGLAEVVAERGYPAVTVADVVKQAKTARPTFYRNFTSKEDAFLAAFEFAVEGLYARVRVASAPGDRTFPQSVRAGLGAFLDWAQAEPALAHLAMVDVLSAGPEAI